MALATISLNDEERAFLVSLLELALKEARIEEHRTRNPTFREHVLHREELLSSVLEKLGQPTS
jgi:hypothetical protein